DDGIIGPQAGAHIRAAAQDGENDSASNNEPSPRRQRPVQPPHNQLQPNKRQKLDSRPSLQNDGSDLDFGDGGQSGSDEDEPIGIEVNQNNGKRHRDDDEASNESRKEARLNAEDESDAEEQEREEVKQVVEGMDILPVQEDNRPVGEQQYDAPGGLDEGRMNAAGMNAQAVGMNDAQDNAPEAPVARPQEQEDAVAHRTPNYATLFGDFLQHPEQFGTALYLVDPLEHSIISKLANESDQAHRDRIDRLVKGKKGLAKAFGGRIRAANTLAPTGVERTL
ncbi:MAG: hypothetical protein SGARI_004679, partial [Bacillariaceae sp.]